MRPVVWSETASRDMLDILLYIAADDIAAAERVVDIIEDAGNRLGMIATGRPGRVTSTYEKSVAHIPYIISYEIRSIKGQEHIIILHVIHTSRNWPAEKWPE